MQVYPAFLKHVLLVAYFISQIINYSVYLTETVTLQAIYGYNFFVSIFF